jgi:hypothetical protein
MDFHFQKISIEMSAVLKKMTVPDNWQRYFCYLSSREALPELAT